MASEFNTQEPIGRFIQDILSVRHIQWWTHGQIKECYQHVFSNHQMTPPTGIQDMLLHFLVQPVKEATDFFVKRILRVLCHLVVARVMSQFLKKTFRFYGNNSACINHLVSIVGCTAYFPNKKDNSVCAAIASP